MEKTTESCYPISHVWIYVDGNIEIAESKSHEKIHADIWGEEAWDNDIRGYFCDKKSIVTCHSRIEKSLLKKIEKGLEKQGLIAIYYKGQLKELCDA